MNIVDIHQAAMQFGSLRALDNLSLSIAEGEVLGLFGPNGAGKTTTMKLILGLLAPTAGSVSVFGQTPFTQSFSQLRYKLGFLPENVSFYPQLTGREILHFFAKLKQVDTRKADLLLDEVGLATAAQRKVKTWSKGMKQRLGLAQAILTEPRLLLLDEPTVGLDPLATQDFYRMVDNLRQKGCAVLLCSHVLPGVEKHIDRAAILGAGKLQALGTLADLRHEASLPMTIDVHGTMDRELLCRQLDRWVISANQVNCQTVQIRTVPTTKLAVLKEIMSHPGVADIDLHPASLDDIYRHFVASTSLMQSHLEDAR